MPHCSMIYDEVTWGNEICSLCALQILHKYSFILKELKGRLDDLI
jgi:hypothetical protein